MARYLLTDLAKADVREILGYLHERSPDAERRVRDELRGAMRRLAAMPYIGHPRTDLTEEPLRFWLVYSYLIIYRPEQRPVEILRVLHASRDVGAELRK